MTEQMNEEQEQAMISAIEIAIDWNLPLSPEEEDAYRRYCDKLSLSNNKNISQ